MRRSMGAALVAAMLSTISVVSVDPAWTLSCPPDDDALTFQEMIDQRITGKDRYPVMFLGVVSSLKDRGGDPDGGRTFARLEVVEHPAGYAPPEPRVRFWREFSDQGTLYRFQFRHGGRYVVIARRLDDGSFRSDGTCGQTKRVDRETFRELVRYARSH